MSSFSSIGHLTPNDLQLLEAECARLQREYEFHTREAQAREKRRNEILSKVKAVRDLLDELASQRGGARVGTLNQNGTLFGESEKAEVPRREKVRRKRGAAVTWLTEIARIVADEPMGVSYEDLKAGIGLGQLADRLRESDKGMYGGIAKLIASGDIVKYRGRLFSRGSFAKFRMQVEAGEIEDISEAVAQRPSPMGDAILAFVRANPFGVASGEIVNELRRFPEFSGTVTRNKTAAYNVIKRLLDRGQLIKEGGKYLPPEENDPPQNTGNGSDAGGSAA